MRSTRRQLLSSAAAATTLACLSGPLLAAAPRRRPPNVIMIYSDDLGYGDVGCYGATEVKTPNIDRLAAEGVRFTQGHCPSATCTPSRYALLTGEYAWRNPHAHILPGDAPALIKPGQDTIAAMFKRAGYTTAVIGKWHMGLGDGDLDWNGKIAPGPLEIGFDYGFYFPATLDRVPCIYIENHDVVNLDPSDPIKVSYTEKVGNDPTGLEHPEQLRMQWNDGHNGTIIDGVSRIGFMEGGHSARWVDEDMADTLMEKAKAFMAKNKDDPFFIYYATSEIHVPRLPAKRFQGTTNMGPRGDSIVELDWVVGEIVNTVKQLGLDDDTLIIFSSDNGPVLNDGYDDDAVTRAGNHRPSGFYRGGKYGIYDGGLMVPTIARWPGSIPSGVTSDALIDHVDFFASLASLVGQKLPRASAVDSFDLAPVVLGRNGTGRTYLVEDTSTINAEQATLKDHGDSIIALVVGKWKMIQPHNPVASFHGNDIGSEPAPQLYNLDEDPGETVNMADRYPDRVKAMLAQLDTILKSDRTRPA
jgi:arylsulfatase A-like enzyme